jgi:hypothetical protein
MKKVIFVLLLSVGSFSLTSFGVVDNPKVALLQKSNLKRINIESKSVQFPVNSKQNTDIEAKVEDVENEEGLLKKIFKITFAFVAKLVWSLMSK